MSSGTHMWPMSTLMLPLQQVIQCAISRRRKKGELWGKTICERPVIKHDKRWNETSSCRSLKMYWSFCMVVIHKSLWLNCRVHAFLTLFHACFQLSSNYLFTTNPFGSGTNFNMSQKQEGGKTHRKKILERILASCTSMLRLGWNHALQKSHFADLSPCGVIHLRKHPLCFVGRRLIW